MMAEWANIKSLIAAMNGKQETERKLMAGELQSLNTQKEIIIGLEQQITDDVTSEYDVTVYGAVLGNIETKKDVYIYGTVKGDIITQERVILHALARVSGDIIASSLSVEDGAEFYGNCRIG